MPLLSALRFIIVLALAQPIQWQTDAQPAIELGTSPDHRLFIRHQGYSAEWQIRLPEVVESAEGTFMTSVRPAVSWKEYGGGLLGYDWSGDTNYARAVAISAGGRIKIISGLTISPRAKAGTNRIELELRLLNNSTNTFHDICVDGGCLAHRTERFFDDNFTNSFIFTASGLTPLDKTDRSMKIRAKYFFHPGWFDVPTTKAYEFFWGRSDTRPAAALVVSRAREGKGAIGIAWDNCLGVRQNSDASHRCMHSSPYSGDLKPGESATLKGDILFADSVEEIVEQFRRKSYRIYSPGPKSFTSVKQ